MKRLTQRVRQGPASSADPRASEAFCEVVIEFETPTGSILTVARRRWLWWALGAAYGKLFWLALRLALRRE
jgi:hypothetical protein